MTTLPSLGTVLRDFFEDYLKLQRGLSLNTVRSYRDSVRLLLLFAARTRGLSVVHLSVSDLTADLVARFLDSLESERGNHVRSRNHRLNALRVLFSFLARRCPECLAEAQRVLAIPMKRTTRPGTSYLERDQVQALLEALPKRGHRALRDRALLLFLYNTTTPARASRKQLS